MKRIYSGCGVCVRTNRGAVDVESLNFSLLAFDTENEAYGWAVNEFKKRLPANDGWAHHEVFLHKVEVSTLRWALKEAEPEAIAETAPS